VEPSTETDDAPLTALAVRGGLGGVLMGLANLVPGISGGTMLLAAGVYPAFIRAIAELTTLRFRTRSILLLGVVAVAAAAAILLLAGPTRALVVERRWVMYSLFIGLTLGGLPLVWRLARPATPALAGASSASTGADTSLLALSGMAGAGAMILPGVSGGYLLLLLGQYLPILAAIDKLKLALLGLRGDAGLDTALLAESLAVVVPVGIGVVVGIVGISNLLRWTLDRFPKATLGVLLGLLLGAVAGLWPFQHGVPPALGEIFNGQPLTQETLAELDREDWPLVRFAPSPGQAGGSLALILLGLAVTLAVDGVGRRLGGDSPDSSDGVESRASEGG